MDFFDFGFGLNDLSEWWGGVLDYVGPRWVPSLGAIVLAGLLYFVAGWILRRLERRLARKTETDLDDQFVRMLRQVVRLTVVAWAAWRIAGEWIPILGKENPDGVFVESGAQPGKWVWGIWMVLVFIPVSRFAGNLLRLVETNVMSRSNTVLDETALPMVNRFVRFLIIGLGVLLAMDYLGLRIAPLLAGAGVVGLALSLAAKDTLSNLIAGVLLILDRPFQVGDRIELWNAPNETGTWGDVIEIGIRATKIRNPDNLVVVVPNNEIMRRDIINYTMSGEDIRLRIPFSVAYEADIERAKVLLIQAALGVEGVKPEPTPIVIVRGFGPSEVNLQLRVWIKEARQRRRVADEITGLALTSFAREGVEIPYPKRELYIRQGDVKALLPSGK